MFKPGDKIRVVDSPKNREAEVKFGLQIGSVHEVDQLNGIAVKSIRLKQAVQGWWNWDADRFELVGDNMEFNIGDKVVVLPNENLYKDEKVWYQLGGVYVGKKFELASKRDDESFYLKNYKGGDQDPRIMSEKQAYVHISWIKKVEEVRFDKAGRARLANGRFAKKHVKAAPLPGLKAEAPKKLAVKPLVQDIRDTLNDEMGARKFDFPSTRGSCTYGVIYEGGKKDYSIRNICQGSLNRRTGDSIQFGMHVKNYSIGQSPEWVKAYKRMLDWIINKSPFAPYILTKDVNEAYEKGVLFDVDKPNDNVFIASVAIRLMNEHYAPLRWVRWVDDGFDERTAWLMCEMLNKDNNDYQVFDGHNIITSDHEYNDVIRFLVEGFDEKLYRNKDSFKKGRNYRVWNIVARQKGKTIYDLLSVLIQKKGVWPNQETILPMKNVYRLALKIEKDILSYKEKKDDKNPAAQADGIPF